MRWKLVRLRPLPFREVTRKLRAAGFEEVSQKGSHVKYARSTATAVRTAILPKHAEIAVGTLRSILRQADITPEEFEQL